jgi:hypothetical protein
MIAKIYERKKDEVSEQFRILQNKELHDVCRSPDILRILKYRGLRWTEHEARMEEKMNAYRILTRKRLGKRPLGRPKRRWEGNIKMDLRDIGYDDGR